MSPNGKKAQLNHEEEKPKSAEQKEFEELLAKFDYAFKRGDVVTGRVINLESHGASVDIGAKTAAFIPGKEIAGHGPDQEKLKPGEAYEFYILRGEDDEGMFTLSRKRVHQAQNWKKLADLMEADTVVEGHVLSVVKGGLLVEVQGLRGFVPSSHLRVRDSFESLIGQTIPLKILSVDQQANNIILSHRKVMAEQMADKRKELFENLAVGALVEGDVVRLTEFGAFIDLGGVDGLLPLSQMSWRWVEHPSDIMKVGDRVKVEVIGIDMEKQRVSLSIKSQFEDPWNQVTKELALGDKVTGTITRVKHFGAFVEVYPGVEALLPSRDVMEYDQSGRGKLDTGVELEVFVVKFNPEERRISLSLHPLPEGMKQQLANASE